MRVAFRWGCCSFRTTNGLARPSRRKRLHHPNTTVRCSTIWKIKPLRNRWSAKFGMHRTSSFAMRYRNIDCKCASGERINYSHRKPTRIDRFALECPWLPRRKRLVDRSGKHDEPPQELDGHQDLRGRCERPWIVRRCHYRRWIIGSWVNSCKRFASRPRWQSQASRSMHRIAVGDSVIHPATRSTCCDCIGIVSRSYRVKSSA